MLTYVSAFTSGGLEPFWPHFWLLSVSVLASFSVGAGIIFESPKYSTSINQAATCLVIFGVIIEAVCTIALFVFDEGISSSQQSTIRNQQAQIRGREVSDEQGKSVIASLKGQKTADFTVIAVLDDIEAGRFAVSLWSLLKVSGVKSEMKFLEKAPESKIFLPVGAMACGDSTPESDRVIAALWSSGTVDQYFPIRPPPGMPSNVQMMAPPPFCPPNSIFVGKRAAPQEIWLPR